MDKTEIFNILWWKDDSGIINYSCRGFGKTYNEFYKNWIPTSSYRCTLEDFPWDYFVFDDPADHERLLKDFPESVSND
jgi:hypothetical protein